MTAPAHDPERLADLVDGRLSPDDAAALLTHVESCAECEGALRLIESGRAGARGLTSSATAPLDLRAAVGRALDVVDQERDETPRPGRWARTLWATAAAAAAVLLWFVVAPDRAPATDIPTQAARDMGAVGSRSLPLGLRTDSAAALEQYLNDRPSGPRVRVIDLAMMGYTLEGAVRHTLENRPSALYAYTTAAGQRLVCQMFEGRLEDLPPPEESRSHRGFTFHVYRRGAATLVFWQEGTVVCVLASELPAADVIQLAFAKAMAPA